MDTYYLKKGLELDPRLITSPETYTNNAATTFELRQLYHTWKISI